MEQYRDRLIRIAERILEAGNPLPVDLEAKMIEAGLDASELRARFDQ